MSDYQRILVVRTDRVGDVVLTTPAVQALREAFPEARLAILVSKATEDLVKGNPFLDEIMTDDRLGAHKGLAGFFKLVASLRAKKFDLAINFHTKKRTNLLCFLAGIPERVGYVNNKFGFLLTRKITDLRPQGIKHESQYCLDLLKAVGIAAPKGNFFLPLNAYAEAWAQKFFEEKIRLGPIRLMFGVHPFASCPTKEWPVQRFAELIDRLTEKYPCRVVLLGGRAGTATAAEICRLCRQPVVDLTGQTSVAQLASLLKRCALLVSNDSGPVHVADALGTPVVSIFTRNQPGINPGRWKPLGQKSRTVVTPFDGDISFAKGEITDPIYLEMIKTEDVLQAVDALFKLC